MKFISICFIILTSNIVDAQIPETNPTINFGNHWIFGRNVHLEFANDTLIQHRINGVDWIEGGASIQTDSGLFFFKGLGQYGKIQSDEFELFPYPYYGFMSSTQGELLLKHTESLPVYSFVSASDNTEGYSFYSKFIDSIFSVKFDRLAFHGGEKQQAVNHQNGRDIWYANHAQTGDSIYFFLIQKDRMIECPIVTHTGNSYLENTATQGQMKFSTDGKYLGEVSFVNPFSIGLYTFNNEYPQTDMIYLHSKGYVPPYTRRWFSGFEFSPDNSKMYIACGREQWAQEPDPVVIYQIDAASGFQDSIEDSWVSLDSLFTIPAGDLQLAPNGKIYISMPNQTYLGVINDPNELGLGCNYQRRGLTLDSGGTSLYGLSTFNQSYFYTPQIDYKYEEDCQTNEYQFWGADTFGATSFEWRFRDVRNSTVDVKVGKNISYTFPNADSLENKYEVTFIASSGSKTDSVSKTITIRPKLTHDFLGRDTFYCEDQNFEITLSTPSNMHCIHWDGLEPYSNLAGDTIVGYENFYGHITANQSLTIDTAGVYTARITNKAFCRAYDTITVEEYASPSKSVINRSGQELESSIVAAEYRWYFNGSLKNTTTDSKLTPDSNGYWQVQLVSEFGCESELSDSFNVGFAGIDKRYETLDLRFEIYPNPSDGNITIAVPKGGDYQVLIYDMTGKLIYNTSQSLSLLFELELELVSGTY
ncbi:MAG: hypothetical protein ACI8ZQ_001473, partial [Bacteroidia bacterium]